MQGEIDENVDPVSPDCFRGALIGYAGNAPPAIGERPKLTRERIGARIVE